MGKEQSVQVSIESYASSTSAEISFLTGKDANVSYLKVYEELVVPCYKSKTGMKSNPVWKLPIYANWNARFKQNILILAV